MRNAPYCRIQLLRRNGDICGETLIDAADLEAVSKYRWLLDNNGYARRSIPGGGQVLLHRELLGLVSGDGRVADHINRKPLDNRRANLRIVDSRTNRLNRGSWRNVSSVFRCVHWETKRRRWRAVVKVDNVPTRLGRFETELEAALAVERWRVAEGPFGWERDPMLP